MRDFLDAISRRVVVYDGGMGATLEQFDLTSEDYGGLAGKCHEALVLNRPDVIEGVHSSMLEAGAEVVETDTFQGSRLKLDEWGLAEHTLEINTRAAQIARRAAGEHRFVAGSIGPTGYLPASEDPSLGQIRFGELVEVFSEQAEGLIEGGADLLIIETAQDILEVKAAIFGAREAFRRTSRTLPIHTSVSLLPNGGKMLLGTDISAVLCTLEALKVQVIGLNCSTGPQDMRDAIRFLGEHCPVPVACIPNAGPAAAGTPRGDDLPGAARAAGGGAGGVRGALRSGHRGRLLRDHAGAHRSDRGQGRRPPGGRAPGAAAGACVVDDRRHAAGPGPAPHPGGRAGQLAGLAQGQGAAAGRRLRRARADRRGPGARRGPRARPVRGADRAGRRGRTDAGAGQAHLADPAGADPGRLDRARGARTCARADSRPGDRQLDQPRGRARQARPGGAAGDRTRRRADRADDRRDRDGQDGRAQARDRRAPARALLRGARARPRAADLRLPYLHARDRRGGVAPLGQGDDRGDQARQAAAPAGEDLARRLERLLRRLPGGQGGAQLRVPAPLRGGRARPGDGQPQPHHPLRRRSHPRSGRWPTTSCSTPATTRWSASSPTSSPAERSRRNPPPPTPPPGWSRRRRCTSTSCAGARKASRSGSTAASRRSGRCRR